MTLPQSLVEFSSNYAQTYSLAISGLGLDCRFDLWRNALKLASIPWPWHSELLRARASSNSKLELGPALVFVIWPWFALISSCVWHSKRKLSGNVRRDFLKVTLGSSASWLMPQTIWRRMKIWMPHARQTSAFISPWLGWPKSLRWSELWVPCSCGWWFLSTEIRQAEKVTHSRIEKLWKLSARVNRRPSQPSESIYLTRRNGP